MFLQRGKVIAYVSISLTETEKRYAHIKKELFSIVYSTPQIHQYIFGKETTSYNDHKPLEQIFAKPLLSAHMRTHMLKLHIENMVLERQRNENYRCSFP